ncbi:MAG: hypothetical protein Q7R33_08090, partial [Nitrosarchaeum sp.]|nr:hypothetical protein [Nitrosarchaeum sp.]
MNHLAQIQIEFLKEARKWDEFSLEDQKGYLKRHPKSKRKITAKPSTDKSIIQSSDILKQFDSIEKEINNWNGTEKKTIAISALYGLKNKKNNINGFVMKNDANKVAAIALIQNDKDKDYIKVKDLASNEKGFGRKAIEHIAAIAAKENKGLALVAMTKDAAAFYKHLGMTEDAKMSGIYRLSANETKSLQSEQKEPVKYQLGDKIYLKDKDVLTVTNNDYYGKLYVKDKSGDKYFVAPEDIKDDVIKVESETSNIKEKLREKRQQFKLPGQATYQTELDNFRQKLLEAHPYLYHTTNPKNLKNIKQQGLNKKYNYFSIDEGWENLGSGQVEIKTKDVIDRIFPDPEMQLPDKYVNQIMKNHDAYSWKEVRNNPEMVKALLNEASDGIGMGNFVVDGPISSKFIQIKDNE